jgi:hypothetical protein
VQGTGGGVEADEEEIAVKGSYGTKVGNVSIFKAAFKT